VLGWHQRTKIIQQVDVNDSSKKIAREVPDPQNQAFNFGIGVGRKFGVKTLGDGIVENQPLPAGETQVRFKTTDITAPFAFFSYNIAW
jgi:hypothetical protein